MNKATPLLATALAVALAFAAPALASERPDHFEGKPAETLEQALSNLNAYNAKLAALLAQGSLTAQDLHTVHELTYTLENALERLGIELEELAETLEEIHVASETADPATVLERGRVYLDTAGKMFK